MVEVIAAEVQAGDPVPGEVGVGLPHDGDDVDLPVRGDVAVRVGGEELHGLRLVVARRRRLDKVADAVEKGVGEAVGDIVLGGTPAVEAVVVLHAVIELCVQIYRGQGGGDRQRRQRRRQTALPAPDPAGRQEAEQEGPQQQAEQSRPDIQVKKQAVAIPRGHGLGLPEDEHVLEVEGVIPEVELVVVAQAEAQGNAAAGQEGGPGPAQSAVKQQDQQGHRDRVQRQDQPALEIAKEDVVGVGPDGQHQKGQTHAQPRAQNHRQPVDGIDGTPPQGPGRIRRGVQNKKTV